MRTILVTGGTVFVSRFVARYFALRGDRVYVLNRNTRPQPEGVQLLEADRHQPGTRLKSLSFDAVLDMTAYTAQDVHQLLDALGDSGTYLLMSSSAVYPDTAAQPFAEDGPTGPNRFWGRYGTDKLAAEHALLSRRPDAYILRPPYLYGPWNNVYREAFVFECALKERPFYLPRDGALPLQFFYIEDVCRFVELVLERSPEQHVFNLGNPTLITVRDWVTLCYEVAGKRPVFRPVEESVGQRQYFCFYDYAYALDVGRQGALLPDLTSLSDGLQTAFAWYTGHADVVKRKPLLEWIDQNLP